MENWIFNPILFTIGPFKAHWYGLMYALAFIIGYLFVHYSGPGKKLPLNEKEKDGVIIAAIIGILLGARFGYAILYNGAYYLQNPAKILAVWEGGMASHGAVIGSFIATILYTHLKKIDLLRITDAILSIAPAGIILIRIGNFINAELYGRIANNFCINFPTDPANCRYPSQLFQAFLEGLVLLVILQLIIHRKPQKGLVTSLFLVLYGLFRIIGELFREPDAQIGFYWGSITQGQILSVLMILAGLILIVKIQKNSLHDPLARAK